LHRFAVGDRPGFIERDEAQLRANFQVDATLDQNPLASRCRQTADDRHRRGNDQRTRAGNHQKYQGAIDPVSPHSSGTEGSGVRARRVLGAGNHSSLNAAKSFNLVQTHLTPYAATVRNDAANRASSRTGFHDLKEC